MVSERIGPWQQKRFGSDWVGEREFSVKSLVAPTTTDRPYAFFGYGGGLDRRNSRSLPRSQLAADGIGLGEGSGPQILVKSLTLDRSVKTTTFMARNEAQSMAFDLPRQTPYYYELRRQLESAELALAASGYRRVVKVPDIVPGKIPNPASISGKRTKTMSELTAVRQVVKYEEVATDPTAVWRIVSTPNLRPSEEPRTLRNLVQPAKIEMVTTRRSDELRRINLNSTQEIQPRGAPEGNLNPPLTGFSVVAMGWEQDQLPNVSVRRIEWENPEDTDEGDFGIPSWLFEDTDEGDFGIPSWLFEDTDEGEFGIPSWLFRLSLPDAVDRAKDLAVLEMDSPTDLLKPINVGLSSDLRVGQQCLAIGNPFGFDHILTASVISGLNRDIFSKAGVTIEDGAHSRMKQGAFLYNLKAQTLPKIHHCYFIKLTLEYCKFSSLDSYESSACKFNNPKHLGKMDENETDQQGKYNYGWLAKEEDYTPGDSVGRFLSENGNHEEKDGGGVVFSGHSDGPNEGIPDLAHWLSLRFVTLRFQVFSTFCNGDFNQRRIQYILREYTESGDADEAFSCIRELGLPFFHLEVVTRALIFGMENILSTPLILKLLKKSTTGCLISSNQMSKGFSQLAESVDDLSLDSPSAITLFDKLVLIAITEEWLDASFSKSAIPDGTIVGREDKKHSQVIRIWDPGPGSKSMNWGDPVMLNLEFVMCDTTLHRELLLTFLPVEFQIENLDWDSCEDDEMMGLHWEISDIICIDCKWTLNVGSALITLLEGSGAETINSGPVKVQFCVTNLQWPSRQQKNWRLASRYQEIWNKIPSDDFELENWSLIVTCYPGEVETFEDGELTSIISNAHVGNAYFSARTHLPDVLFTGGEDGAIRLLSIYDISDDEDINSAVTWVPHVNPVHSLAFEYPWLASASSDGRISLIDLRKLLAPKGSSKHPFRVKSFGPSAIAPPQRVINLKNWNLTACRTAFHQGNDQQTYSETRGHDFVLNISIDEIKVAEYDGLVILGGCAPEFLASDKRVFNSVRKFSGTQKPIASVYYGRLILAATAVGWNRTCTAYPAVKPVLVAAAARWEEADTMAKCLADGNLFTAASYDAHPEFISLFEKALGGSVTGLNKRIWFPSGKYFLAGVGDGLNNWVDDLVAFVEKNKLVVSTYCSLMHTVVDFGETGMIHGYGFVGKMDKAVKLIDGRVLTGWKPNAFICSTLLDGYCKEGRTVDATTLFKEMLGKGINPGAIIYSLMLLGSLKSGRTAAAKKLFKSLKVVYKLQLPERVGIHPVFHDNQLKIHCSPKAISSPGFSLESKDGKLIAEPISLLEIKALLRRDRLITQWLIPWGKSATR